MAMNGRMTVVAMMVGAATIAAVVGCSSSGTPTSSGTTTVGQSGAVSSQPAVTSAAPHVLLTQAQPHGSAGGIDVTLAAQGSTTVRPGGPPMRFTVTLVNTTTTDIDQVGMVVSLGHCSCSPSGARMMPAGSMRMLDPSTQAWVTVPYDSEGTGMDYINETLVPPFVLIHGQTITYQLQMQLHADQGFTVGNGESDISVTMTNVATYPPTRLGTTSSLPITVEP
ncbi:MAG: hypothetical protein QOC69_5771 [Mycobacterium sp.]|jgi:hypothetical protein|nr:hypothetical protein [Mycobacterium sp.]